MMFIRRTEPDPPDGAPVPRPTSLRGVTRLVWRSFLDAARRRTFEL